MIIYFENFTFCRKDFSFVINFVNSSKSETQHDVYKIYSHVIETPSTKSETQHGVHKRKHVLKNINVDLQNK